MSGKITLKETSRDDCGSSYDVIWAGIEDGNLEDFLADLAEHAGPDPVTVQVREAESAKDRNPRAIVTLEFKNAASIRDDGLLPEDIAEREVIRIKAAQDWNGMDYYVTISRQGRQARPKGEKKNESIAL